MSILIQNGTLLLPEGPARADLRLEGDKIAQIGPGLPVEDSRVVDASGRLVFPGFIDTHTHFEMNKGTDRETADDWATGTRAALAGGTTCVLDLPSPSGGPPFPPPWRPGIAARTAGPGVTTGST